MIYSEQDYTVKFTQVGEAKSGPTGFFEVICNGVVLFVTQIHTEYFGRERCKSFIESQVKGHLEIACYRATTKYNTYSFTPRNGKAIAVFKNEILIAEIPIDKLGNEVYLDLHLVTNPFVEVTETDKKTLLEIIFYYFVE